MSLYTVVCVCGEVLGEAGIVGRVIPSSALLVIKYLGGTNNKRAGVVRMRPAVLSQLGLSAEISAKHKRLRESRKSSAGPSTPHVTNVAPHTPPRGHTALRPQVSAVVGKFVELCGAVIAEGGMRSVLCAV